MEKANCIHKLSLDSSGDLLHFIYVWQLLGITMVFNECYFSHSRKLALRLLFLLLFYSYRIIRCVLLAPVILDNIWKKKISFNAWGKVNKNKNVNI